MIGVGIAGVMFSGVPIHIKLGSFEFEMNTFNYAEIIEEMMEYAPEEIDSSNSMDSDYSGNDDYSYDE